MIADDRDRIADERDTVADERDRMADGRDKVPDERPAQPDELEITVAERQRRLDMRARALRETAPDTLLPQQEAIDRSRRLGSRG